MTFLRRCSLFAIAFFICVEASPAQTVSAWETVPKQVRERNSFKRFEWFYRQRAMPLDTIPIDAFLRTMEQEKRIESLRKASRGSSSDVVWTPLGPTGITSSFPTQWGVCSGRVRGLAVHPTNPDIAYIGVASGGIWKTTDGGATWTDAGSAMASLTFGAIAIDPKNPNVVYAGSGEAMRYFNIYTYEGRGLYKSTDGGGTWTQITNGFGTRTHFSSLKASPVDSNLVYATIGSGNWLTGEKSNEGFWRSTDGGVTWTRTFGANDGFDILPHPTTHGRVYAASGGGASSGSFPGFYVSTDSGKTWSASNSGLPATGNIDRMQIALAPSTPSTIYALIYSSPSNGTIRLYKSTDDGATWAAASSSFASSQGWYDLLLGVSPTNPSDVYIGDSELQHSMDGGATFSYVGGAYNTSSATARYWNQEMHVDFHIMVIAPSNSSIRYVGCDGGIYRSTDGGATWSHRNNGLTTLQFYRLSSHPTDQNTMIGGAQDNGLYRSTNGGTGNWPLISTGDGMESFYNYGTPTTVYVSIQQGALARSLTSGNFGTFSSIKPNFGTEAVAWTAPFFIHPTNSSWIYTASNRPYRSTDGGTSWTPLTSPLTGTVAINTMDISPALPDNMILAGSEYSTIPTIWVSSNGGTNWTNVTTKLLDAPQYISRVVCHPIESNTMFLVRSGYSAGKVYRTTDLGNSWTNITGNLPDVPHNDLFVDPGFTNNYYVANDLGVYLSTDAGATWARQGNGMPYVPVMDFNYARYGAIRYLRVGTYGRSVFQATLPTITGAIIAVSRPLIDFGNIEVGVPSDTLVISINNLGSAQLTVTSITKASPAYSLFSLPTLPASVAPLGSTSFRVLFKPTAAGTSNDTIAIASNDTIYPSTKIILKGTGFIIATAQQGTMYAVSGLADGGKLYSVNTSTGVATFIASTGLTQVASLRVHPTTKELIGLDPSAGSSAALVRISSAGVNLRQISTLGGTNLKGLAFKNDSTVYIGALDGSIYALNIKTAAATLVASTGVRIGGLALNPISGELWMSNRLLGTRDALYKVNLTAGTASLVGTTGLADYTNDILFDKNGKLYGILGAGSTTNTLIVIDTATAAGFKIGSGLGMSGIQAIALNPDVPADVNILVTNTIPKDFSLDQNFPNPFNPATNISFSLPSAQVVSLKVSDLLGREVSTLVNGEMKAGKYSVQWDASHFSSGVYLYKLTAGNFTDSKRMIVVK